MIQAAAALLFLAGMYFWSRPQAQTQELEFGMFTGSNWGVENADAFVIIDRAIERFEESHPGVTVRYTSGIEKRITPSGVQSAFWKEKCRMSLWFWIRTLTSTVPLEFCRN